MRAPFPFVRSFVALALVATAACGRSSTAPSGLLPEDIAGIYHICEIVFTPNNQQLYPALDIRAAAIDGSPTAEAPPRLFVDDRQRRFALQYMRGTFLERFEGSYNMGRQHVTLAFSTPTVVASELLLPPSLPMDFRDAPHRLEFTRAGHDVSGADYARLRNVSPEDAPTSIRGTVSARFQVGGCGA